MKVLYILHSSIMGGATISFLNLLTGIKLKGVDPYVIINKEIDDDKFNTVLNKNGIPFYRAIIVKSVITRKKTLRGMGSFVKQYCILTLKIIKSRRDIERICQKIKPDIIHSNTGVVHEGFWVAKKLHIPHVWHLREYQTKDFNWFIYPSKKIFCSELLKSYVITITNDIKTYFKLNDSLKAFTINNGIFNRGKTFPVVKKENYFILCSRVSPEKGHEEAIRAFSCFSRKSEYKLIVAGFGDPFYISYLNDLAKSLDCSDQVKFVGFYEEVVDLLSKAKALLVPSYYEGFGRMTAEAAFCGTIVIGRDTGGTKEIINKTRGGYLFSTTEEFTAKMELIASLSAEEYINITETARQIAKESYSIEENVNQIFSLYSHILYGEKQIFHV